MSTDDKPLYSIKRDLSGGMNSRSYPTNLTDNQAQTLYNADIGTPGESKVRLGLASMAHPSLASIANPPHGAFTFDPSGGTSNILLMEKGNLYRFNTGEGLITLSASLPSISDYAVLGARELTNGEVALVYKIRDGWYRMLQNYTLQSLGTISGTGYDSPPLSPVATYYGNRMWVLKNDLLYFSRAIPAVNASLSGYGTAFDTPTSVFNVPVGTEQALVGTRDKGILAFGSKEVWGVSPSAVPVATDIPTKILPIGCVSGKTVVQVGDDIFFLAKDGVRGLFRTQLDQLQANEAVPLSHLLKTEYDLINWAYINKACAVAFDNKYFISLPTSSSTYNNQVWIYYPAYKSWVVVTGWNVSAWTKMTVSGEERLFAVDSVTGQLYRAWSGYTDNGTAISYQEIGRKEDLSQPLVKKIGGEVTVKVKSAGSYSISVYANFDDKGWEFLGNVSSTVSYVTFPVTFPVQFPSSSMTYEKFHIDINGEWYTAQIKVTHSDILSEEVSILERGIITYPVEYSSEDI